MTRYLSLLTVLLALLPATPGMAQERQRCFEATGACTAGQFLGFWERNGGLPVFGLALGDRRPERAPEGRFDAQWFERERFEAHPENRPPYDVLLGRLGDEQLRRQGRDWASFPREQPRAGCRFFSETGHNLCEPFLSYWRGHGLEFDGRRGTSEAESLALFGLPLSAPQPETNSSGDTVVTQWFERARFEHHPQNPPAYQVLLGRLGAELYDPAAAPGAASYVRVQQPGWPHALEVPAGFTIEEAAAGIPAPRFMAIDPANGSLVYGSSTTSQVIRLIDTNADGRYDQQQVVAGGLPAVHSVAFIDGRLYAAAEDRLVRLGGFDANGTARQIDQILALPSGSRDLYGHRTRTIALGPDGLIYVSIGSSCDVCIEDDARRAAILRLRPDGSGVETVATGLRNTVGFDWRYDGSLWGADMGRNNIGAGLPPDELVRIEQGKNYGWPYCYGARFPNPEFNDAARCAGTEPPALDLPAHWAPLGFAFYTASSFPPAYQNDALVAFHGTATDQVQDLSGYVVSRVRFLNGRPVALQDLVRGWLAGGQVWGRPAGLLVAPDGSLLISDDYGGRIYRLRYVGR